MPRTRQYQAPNAPNNQAYGMRGDQMAAQNAMPLPQAPGAPAMPAGMPQGGGPEAEAGLMEQALAFDPGITPMSAPTTRPNEPVTAGLTRGPGPGPEVLMPGRAQAQAVADTLRELADMSGDQMFSDLADRLTRYGGF